MSDMFIHKLTLFVKVKDGGNVYYMPFNISRGFITRKSSIAFDERGMRFVGTGYCVIPISALSSLDRGSPVASDTPQDGYFAGEDVFMEGDFIASGIYTDEQYTAKTIAKLPMCFCIKSVTKNDFSSLPCYVLSGE